MIKTGPKVDLFREASALQALGYPAVDVVDLVDIDADTAELVTMRALPGDDLRPLARTDDDAATGIIASLIVGLRIGQTPPEDSDATLPPLSQVLEPLRSCRDPRVPRALIDAAVSLGEELVSDAGAAAVHGDLQHRNIARSVLDGEERWRVIDPHGWWGDPSFDAAAVLVAPESVLMGLDVTDARGIAGEPLFRRLHRRIEIIAEIAGDDRDRLLAWSLVGAVIAEARMIAHHDLVHGAPLALAEVLRASRS